MGKPTAPSGSSGRAKAAVETPSEELTFEETMKNNSLPPCSLNDFMDYLLYVEHTAENLQFFLWYCDYVQRWSQLLPRQRRLSPVWDPELHKPCHSGPRVSIHKRSDSEKLTKILTIMARDTSLPGRSRTAEEPEAPGDESPCRVETPHDWQPYTIQPFRDEVTKVVRHYLAESSPRQLDLFPQERNACFYALQYTTHPSTLLPAFTAAETALKTQSHVKFAKWTLRNANRHRLGFIHACAAAVALFGVALDILFILSGASHFFRVASLVFWWPALAAIYLALHGMCFFLYCQGARALRPWEQFPDLPPSPKGSDDGGAAAHGAAFDQADAAETGRCSAESPRVETFSRIDPLRKASLQAFGPKNDVDAEGWTAAYAGRPLHRRIFEPTVPVSNKRLRLLQSRVVFKAIAYGGAISVLLTTASIFIPGVRMF